ncbi:RegN [Richelia sinica FACHB-800]|uniref:RegN n=1 Tax=Richelia sinica FACHB-800 TaxID=1357546 RepID=A0A975T4F0_9NOST|nr:TetR/AcrR family transcriptional regulator [Richelia sinica]MBD2663085.1 TetR/AcrR family transcriptional regulator [Richelia sinica FACHB-800]QXE21952.1 RegN [Richelia sinica FACHB-800]
MARTQKITNEQILAAAREVFLDQGFTGSTLDIAQKAGISEASIFKRFSTKEELFFASMGIPEKPQWVQEIESLVGKGDIKQNLIYISQQILDFYRQVMPRMMMLRSCGKTLPEMNSTKSKPSRDLKALTLFLEQEIAQGRLRCNDAKTMALMLIGSLMNYVFLEQMNVIPSVITPEPMFIQQMVEMIWQGIAPALED